MAKQDKIALENYGAGHDRIWKKTRLQNALSSVYDNHKDGFEKGGVIDSVTEIAGKRGLSYQKRIEKIGNWLNFVNNEGYELNDSENACVGEVLDTVYNNIKETRTKRNGHVRLKRKIKDAVGVGREIIELKRNFEYFPNLPKEEPVQTLEHSLQEDSAQTINIEDYRVPGKAGFLKRAEDYVQSKTGAAKASVAALAAVGIFALGGIATSYFAPKTTAGGASPKAKEPKPVVAEAEKGCFEKCCEEYASDKLAEKDVELQKITEGYESIINDKNQAAAELREQLAKAGRPDKEVIAETTKRLMRNIEENYVCKEQFNDTVANATRSMNELQGRFKTSQEQIKYLEDVIATYETRQTQPKPNLKEELKAEEILGHAYGAVPVVSMAPVPKASRRARAPKPTPIKRTSKLKTVYSPGKGPIQVAVEGPEVITPAYEIPETSEGEQELAETIEKLKAAGHDVVGYIPAGGQGQVGQEKEKKKGKGPIEWLIGDVLLGKNKKENLIGKVDTDHDLALRTTYFPPTPKGCMKRAFAREGKQQAWEEGIPMDDFYVRKFNPGDNLGAAVSWAYKGTFGHAFNLPEMIANGERTADEWLAECERLKKEGKGLKSALTWVGHYVPSGLAEMLNRVDDKIITPKIIDFAAGIPGHAVELVFVPREGIKEEEKRWIHGVPVFGYLPPRKVNSQNIQRVHGVIDDDVVLRYRQDKALINGLVIVKTIGGGYLLIDAAGGFGGDGDGVVSGVLGGRGSAGPGGNTRPAGPGGQ